MSYVYILRCGDGSLYTGIAKDLDRRMGEHLKGTAAKYTRSRLPVRLLWSHRVRTWGNALRVERRIKGLRRPDKAALAAGTLDPRPFFPSCRCGPCRSARQGRRRRS